MTYLIAFLLFALALILYFIDRPGKLRSLFRSSSEKSGEAASIIQDLTIALKSQRAMKKFSPQERKKARKKNKLFFWRSDLSQTKQAAAPVKQTSAPAQIKGTEKVLGEIDEISLPQAVEQGAKGIDLTLNLKNLGQSALQITHLDLQFCQEQQDFSHEYIIRTDADNPTIIDDQVQLHLKVDIGHQATTGPIEIQPQITLKSGQEMGEAASHQKFIWQVEPKGRNLIVKTEHDGQETAGSPFKLFLEVRLKGRLDKSYQGVKRVYFTTSETGTVEYPSQIPSYLDLNFHEGVAETEKWFCFYNTSETPTIHSQDKTAGGARGSSSNISVAPATVGSLQLHISSPQTSGMPLRGENYLQVLDIYSNLKSDFDNEVELSVPATCTISGLAGRGGNILESSFFREGKADLSELGMSITSENLSEPLLIRVTASEENKTGYSDEILLEPPSAVQSASEESRTARTVFRRLLANRKKKIWVANCEADVVKILEENFAGEYEVKSVPLSSENIEALSEEKPDILFLDAGNSNKSGYEILSRIRSQPETEQLPVLFLGPPFESEQKILTVLRHGGAYVTKPLAIPAVKARVTELLENATIGQSKLPVRGSRLQGSDGLIYKVISKIGEGGMGYIYEAERLRDQERVIIKYLPPTEYKDIKAVMRFMQEALTVINFNHENLVQGYDVLMDRNRAFYVMELISGKTLETLIEEEYRLSPLKSMDITLQVARALESLYEEHHLVHRDIKPANILIMESGLVKVVDFGIAKVTDRHCSMTTRGIILGTPYYLSPEQILGKEVTIQSDLYSLGATFYHMLTGEVPFQGNDVLDIIHQRLSRDPRDPREMNSNIPAPVARIVLKMMQKKPNRRYQSAEELILDLEAVIDHIRSGGHLAEAEEHAEDY